MKLWKKAVSVLLGFCMMIGGLALAPKMDVRAAGPVQVYVSPGQTVAINKTRNNIYVKDTNGACVQMCIRDRYKSPPPSRLSDYKQIKNKGQPAPASDCPFV